MPVLEPVTGTITLYFYRIGETRGPDPCGFAKFSQGEGTVIKPEQLVELEQKIAEFFPQIRCHVKVDVEGTPLKEKDAARANGHAD